ncbi:unnamed protein product [Microthlaspi erraticum]|uniref:Uncharacterized protein n=1 Tax=Microthlaspi erraticum TaxID=1685480 RepID=A0A6D2K3S6_9BRAS|nr:unnamed protein product [Microthlaspi erraticum]
MCNLTSLCAEPMDILLGERGIKGRPFFEKCLRSRNRQATYFDALRLAVSGNLYRAIILMESNGTEDPYSVLAAAILSILSGDEEDAGMLLRIFAEKHAPLNSDRARSLGICLTRQISSFCPSYFGRNISSFTYPPDLMPPCVFEHRQTPRICNTCSIYWSARRVYSML